MKYYYLLLFFFIAFQPDCYSQESRIYTDTIAKYEIKIPKEWSLKKLSNSNLFITTGRKSPIKFFTIVIAKSETHDLEESYNAFVYKWSDAENFKILKQGEKIINDRKYKWFTESHKSKRTELEETTYILFTNKDGKVLQLIMAAEPKDLEVAKNQFDKIVETLKY